METRLKKLAYDTPIRPEDVIRFQFHSKVIHRNGVLVLDEDGGHYTMLANFIAGNQQDGWEVINPMWPAGSRGFARYKGDVVEIHPIIVKHYSRVGPGRHRYHEPLLATE